MKKKPFWEDTYSKEGAPNTFNSGKPSWDVVKVVEDFGMIGNVLDLGAGDGRNTIYLAKKWIRCNSSRYI